MFWSSVLSSILEILAYIPWPHWVAIGVLTLAVVFLVRRRTSLYGAIALAIAVFAGLLFIETTVVVRWCGFVQNGWGLHLNLDLGRILHIHSDGYETLFNIVAFIPFGFFLAEYLATRRPAAIHRAVISSSATTPSSAATPPSATARWRILLLSILITFCLSLCIESLQLALRVGFFELTDLVMNTLGGLLGAGLSLLLRAIFCPKKK